MIYRVEKVHAEECVNQCGRNSKKQVHRKKSFCHFFDPGNGTGGIGARAFRINHAGASFSGLRKEGYKDDDDSQAAEPVGQGAEEKNAFRQNG